MFGEKGAGCGHRRLGDSYSGGKVGLIVLLARRLRERGEIRAVWVFFSVGRKTERSNDIADIVRCEVPIHTSSIFKNSR